MSAADGLPTDIDERLRAVARIHAEGDAERLGRVEQGRLSAFDTLLADRDAWSARAADAEARAEAAEARVREMEASVAELRSEMTAAADACLPSVAAEPLRAASLPRPMSTPLLRAVTRAVERAEAAEAQLAALREAAAAVRSECVTYTEAGTTAYRALGRAVANAQPAAEAYTRRVREAVEAELADGRDGGLPELLALCREPGTDTLIACVTEGGRRFLVDSSDLAEAERMLRTDELKTRVRELEAMCSRAHPWMHERDEGTPDELRALRTRWATAPELYQADADLLICTALKARARAEAAEEMAGEFDRVRRQVMEIHDPTTPCTAGGETVIERVLSDRARLRESEGRLGGVAHALAGASARHADGWTTSGQRSLVHIEDNSTREHIASGPKKFGDQIDALVSTANAAVAALHALSAPSEEGNT